MEYLSVREVSLALSIPERTVEYHLAQALKMMRVYLRDFIVLLVLFQSQLALSFKYDFFMNNL
ncbi:hypothetical protein D3C87_1907510 [compost metagenome]